MLEPKSSKQIINLKKQIKLDMDLLDLYISDFSSRSSSKSMMS